MQSPETLFSLKEAAALAKSEPSEFLRAGARDQLTLLVGVPNGVSLRLVDAQRKEAGVGEPALMRIPNVLTLSRELCQALLINGSAIASHFPLGFAFDVKLGFRRLAPADCDANVVEGQWTSDRPLWRQPRTHWNAWCIHDGKTAGKMAITVEQLLVMNTDIDRLFGVDPAKPGNVNELYKSDLLQYMNQAAWRFWGNSKVVTNDSTTHPTNEEVAAWLNEKGMGQVMASKAASILRPAFATKGRKPEM